MPRLRWNPLCRSRAPGCRCVRRAAWRRLPSRSGTPLHSAASGAGTRIPAAAVGCAHPRRLKLATGCARQWDAATAAAPGRSLRASNAATVRTVMSAKRRVRKFTMNRETRASSQQGPPAWRRPRSMHCTRDAADKARARIPRSSPQNQSVLRQQPGHAARVARHIRRTVRRRKASSERITGT